MIDGVEKIPDPIVIPMSRATPSLMRRAFFRLGAWGEFTGSWGRESEDTIDAGH